MPTDGSEGGRGPWGKSGQNQPDLEKLIRQGQAQLQSILPGGSPRGLIAVGVLEGALVAVCGHIHEVNMLARLHRLAVDVGDQPLAILTPHLEHGIHSAHLAHQKARLIDMMGAQVASGAAAGEARAVAP